MNILVTGGVGYIGSHAWKALAKAGCTPIAYDNLVHGHEWAVKWGPLEIGDIPDRKRLNEVIKQYQLEAVIHFAAYAYVGESVQDPGRYYRNNVAGTLTSLEAVRDHGIKTLIFSCTCATYGIPKQVPITEDHPQQPINPYGMSKLMIEHILRDFDRAHSLRSTSLRYFNAAGADPECEVREFHEPETHLIPLGLDAATGIRPVITVFGDDYDTPDGTCIWDYILVSDLADAHVLALRALENGASTTAYNLGNGMAFSLQEVIKAIEVVTQRPMPFEIGPHRAGDPLRLVGDASRAKDGLWWSPQFTELQGIVETAFKWHSTKY